MLPSRCEVGFPDPITMGKAGRPLLPLAELLLWVMRLRFRRIHVEGQKLEEHELSGKIG